MKFEITKKVLCIVGMSFVAVLFCGLAANSSVAIITGGGGLAATYVTTSVLNI
ncbi:MAG: hypothetical protein WCT49_02380 [Candidatus Paceibacterota bacterium]|jgi:hypothetical protein|nr:hypothetical protein [Candidatus Paceibacterota bacterium]